MKNKGLFSLRYQVFIFAAISGIVPLLLTIIFLYNSFMNFFEVRIEKEILGIAHSVADDINVKAAFAQTPVDKDILQQTSVQLKSRSGAYIIFLNMDGSPQVDTHPFNLNPGLSANDKERVLSGQSFTSRTAAYSAPAILAFVPIYNANQQVGVVIAAFLEPDIDLILSRLYESVYLVLPFAFVIILILSLLLANNIKKKLYGMEPFEIATKLSEREEILNAVKEGIIATDDQLTVTVVNQSAQALFPKETKIIGEKITNLISDSPLPNVITAKRPHYNKQLSINDNIVISNSVPLLIQDKIVGTVMTFSNLTEVNHLAEELTGVKRILEALRASTHEFSNKLHAISGLLQLGSYEDAKKYVARLVIDETTLMSCLLGNFRINAVTGLLMSKASEAEEKRINFEIDRESYLFSLPDYFDEHAIVIVLGNLLENAFDAAKNHAKTPEVFLSIKQTETMIKIEVKDNGGGIPENLREKIYEPGFTTKMYGTGYGLFNVKSRVKAAGGEISYLNDKEGTTFQVTIPYDALIDKEQGGTLEWK